MDVVGTYKQLTGLEESAGVAAVMSGLDTQAEGAVDAYRHTLAGILLGETLGAAGEVLVQAQNIGEAIAVIFGADLEFGANDISNNINGLKMRRESSSLAEALDKLDKAISDPGSGIVFKEGKRPSLDQIKSGKVRNYLESRGFGTGKPSQSPEPTAPSSPSKPTRGNSNGRPGEPRSMGDNKGSPDAKPDFDIPKPDPRPDPKPDPKPEPKPDPKPEPKPDPKPEPKPDPKPETEPDEEDEDQHFGGGIILGKPVDPEHRQRSPKPRRIDPTNPDPKGTFTTPKEPGQTDFRPELTPPGTPKDPTNPDPNGTFTTPKEPGQTDFRPKLNPPGSPKDPTNPDPSGTFTTPREPGQTDFRPKLNPPGTPKDPFKPDPTIIDLGDTVDDVIKKTLRNLLPVWKDDRYFDKDRLPDLTKFLPEAELIEVVHSNLSVFENLSGNAVLRSFPGASTVSYDPTRSHDSFQLVTVEEILIGIALIPNPDIRKLALGLIYEQISGPF